MTTEIPLSWFGSSVHIDSASHRLIASIIPDSLIYSESGILNRQFNPLYKAIQSVFKPSAPSWVADGNQIEPFIGDISRLYSTFA